MRRLAILGVVGVSLAGAGGFAAPAAADVFRFEEESGAVHYTNIPADPRYRFFQTEPPSPPPPAASRSAPQRRGLAVFAEAIRTAAERHGVDRRLVEAVVQVESGGNPGAVSPKGAQGLMQLMPQRSAELGVRDPFNPLQNLDGGVRHLRDLLQRFAGNVTLALAAYNAGEAAVRTYQGVPPYPETRDYVRKVHALFDGTVLLPVAAAPQATPQEIFQQVAEDGTVIFTNLPPRPAPALRRAF
ncbi:MAG TPA: lytic transglycosylase domain-containing protein [Methylomirabilota bacterium]|nr:lytic transglycosylase domain-containing protein [Methylomirabilota bacterium]